MILSEEGKYYFDEEKKFEFNKEIFAQLVKIFFYQFNEQPIISQEKIVNGIKFTFKNELKLIRVISSVKREDTILNVMNLKLKIIKSDNEKFEIDSFSKEQINKILEYNEIKYPCINSLIFSKQIKKRIYDIILDSEVEVTNVPLKKIYDEKALCLKKNKNAIFGDLSKYIELYIKSGINIKGCPEEKFFKEDDFLIKKEDNMKYYWNSVRGNFFQKLAKTKDTIDYYFITGPHGIGKTFCLLGYLKYVEKEPSLYINLDILSNSNNYMEIIFYEARNFFDSFNEMDDAFKYIQQNLFLPILETYSIKTSKKIDNGILRCVQCLLEYYDKKKIHQKAEKIIIVVDQFKYINDNENNTLRILELIKFVESSKRFFLIVCSSLNYFGVKNNLLQQIEGTLCKFYYDYFNNLFDKPEFINNKYLSLFGYFPRFCQFSNKINKKYLNLIKRKINRKIYDFYLNNETSTYNKEDLILTKIKWIIEKRNIIINEKEFNEFLKNNPIKFFSIDIENRSFDYLYPLINTIYEDIKKKMELKISFSSKMNTQSEKGWVFERLLFDKISSSNLFLDQYIENVYTINTIYKKEKIENFNPEASCLIYFTINNVKNYDGIIYIPEQKCLILVQASIHKSKKKLSQYTDNNLKNDITKINKCLKVNKIFPEKYYLIFVLDYKTYNNNEDYVKELNAFKYNYCFYNVEKEEITSLNQTLKEIKYQEDNEFYANENEITGYFFTKNKKLNLISENTIEKKSNKSGFYFAYKGMDLVTFLEEIFDEYTYLIEYISQSPVFLSYNLKCFTDKFESFKYIQNLGFPSSDKIVITINEDNELLFGRTKSLKKNGTEIVYEWKKWYNSNSPDYFFNTNSDTIDEDIFEKKFSSLIDAYFVFENHKTSTINNLIEKRLENRNKNKK